MTRLNTNSVFSSETLRLLQDAVDEDDVIDDSAALPEKINLTCSFDDINNCYALCLQFWQQGFQREELLKLIKKTTDGGGLTEAEQRRYKYIRARYKHLRFAQRLYSRNHKADLLFRHTTVLLGHFQDAFRNGNEANINYYGRALRMMLSKPVWLWVCRHLRRVNLDNAAGFMGYRQRQMAELRKLIGQIELTGAEFHHVRKIISQQVSHYDTMRSLNPNDRDARKVSKFLANINGLMGNRHDEMVAARLLDEQSYDRSSKLANNIRQPVEFFLESCPS